MSTLPYGLNVKVGITVLALRVHLSVGLDVRWLELVIGASNGFSEIIEMGTAGQAPSPTTRLLQLRP
jgi:hypothetical protein